jgi:uncharacterized protein (DUF2461 family)
MHAMERDQLARYRQAVDAERSGAELTGVIASLARQKIDVQGHEEMTRVPRGYPADHPRADLLKYKGIIAWQDWPAGAWLGKATAQDRVVKFLRATQPLDDWLEAHVGPAVLSD